MLNFESSYLSFVSQTPDSRCPSQIPPRLLQGDGRQYCFSVLFCFVFLGPHPWHTEVSMPETESEPVRSFNPLCWAGDQTLAFTATGVFLKFPEPVDKKVTFIDIYYLQKIHTLKKHFKPFRDQNADALCSASLRSYSF